METGIRAGANRRAILRGVGATGVASLAGPALAAQTVTFPFAGGGRTRTITTAFPQKGPMILQRTRPPLLETPFEVFDRGLYTPNDRFYVRWHWSIIPTAVQVEPFRLRIGGHVERPLELSLADLMAMPRIEYSAVNQCSGNSRGFFSPRVAGGEWGDGAMGNARWTGVRLKDVLDRAGVKPGAVQARFNGLERPVVADSPWFKKSLAIDHARDGEVMIAFLMNGEQLPLLNGFPIRLVVPGWYATYWVKMLETIEVLDKPDDNFWMKVAYQIPDTPNADMKPGQAGVKTVPINKMSPRSFLTNLVDGAKVALGKDALARGIAFGGSSGVAKVDFSADGGKTWIPAALGKEEGKYGFRAWEARFTPAKAGAVALQVRCTDVEGEVQPTAPNWNPAGFMRNLVETVTVQAA